MINPYSIAKKIDVVVDGNETFFVAEGQSIDIRGTLFVKNSAMSGFSTSQVTQLIQTNVREDEDFEHTDNLASLLKHLKSNPKIAEKYMDK